MKLVNVTTPRHQEGRLAPCRAVAIARELISWSPRLSTGAQFDVTPPAGFGLGTGKTSRDGT